MPRDGISGIYYGGTQASWIETTIRISKWTGFLVFVLISSPTYQCLVFHLLARLHNVRKLGQLTALK
jgi:hypothetical protein